MTKRNKDHSGGCKFDFSTKGSALLTCTMNPTHWMMLAEDRRDNVLVELLDLDYITGNAKKEAIKIKQYPQELLRNKVYPGSTETSLRIETNGQDTEEDEWDL